MAEFYYLYSDDENIRNIQYTFDDIRKKILDKSLNMNCDYIWKDGYTEWIIINQCKDFEKVAKLLNDDKPKSKFKNKYITFFVIALVFELIIYNLANYITVKIYSNKQNLLKSENDNFYTIYKKVIYDIDLIGKRYEKMNKDLGFPEAEIIRLNIDITSKINGIISEIDMAKRMGVLGNYVLTLNEKYHIYFHDIIPIKTETKDGYIIIDEFKKIKDRSERVNKFINYIQPKIDKYNKSVDAYIDFCNLHKSSFASQNEFKERYEIFKIFLDNLQELNMEFSKNGIISSFEGK